MNVVVSCLLWFYIIYNNDLQGGAIASYTNGFPTRLVYRVSVPAGPNIRLIPEMNFTCNEVIVGYTAALSMKNQSGDQDPIIQVWRKNQSHPGSYYRPNTSIGIAIDNASCVGGLTEVSREVFHCNLNQTIARVSIQPGDILGLELPNGDDDDIRLAFASVTSGPTNYVFSTVTEELSSSITLGSSANSSSMVQELPQISLEIGSNESTSRDCIRGFPNTPVSGRDRRTNASSITALLIPGMNFTCNVTIVGFTVAGGNVFREPYSKIQIWRRNHSTYYQVEHNIFVNATSGGPVCAASRSMGSGTFTWCILQDNFRISVQPGDILGLELPDTEDDIKIYFTRGGPLNYVFSGRLGSTINNLSYNESFEKVEQLPQIMFSLTSDHCLWRFPDIKVCEGNSSLRRGELGRVTTRLFPDLQFGCSGTIVGVTAAILDAMGGQNPEIQIWKKNVTQPDIYHKMSSTSNLFMWPNDDRCYRSTLSNGIYQCYALKENYRLSVQPGDFLGLEIPPTNNHTPEIYFKAGGPTNLLFQSRLNSTVNLSTEPHILTYDEPQITFLVVLDENSGSRPSGSSNSTSQSDATTQESNQNTDSTITLTPDHESPEILESSVTITIMIIGVMGGLIAILVLTTVVVSLTVLCLIQQRKLKSIITDDNPADDVSGVGLQRESRIEVESDDITIYYTVDSNDKNLVDIDKSCACPNPAYGVSSRGLAQRKTINHHDKDGVFLNPAYGVSRRSIPRDGDEAPDHVYEEVTVLK